jgi:hypothetical protein
VDPLGFGLGDVYDGMRSPSRETHLAWTSVQSILTAMVPKRERAFDDGAGQVIARLTVVVLLPLQGW